ncbi:hypothetical protein EVAR_60048_1 [Eumeta japonica]|uniref:Integrin alpha-2 domain-containing protein n=1 Tax=Eumeta variegata TaxID=151549 RepID=A0A4C1YUP3_EUMVA|nr:hypothetical protein EVAR_60048_1 [Eumeta japonica]
MSVARRRYVTYLGLGGIGQRTTGLPGIGSAAGGSATDVTNSAVTVGSHGSFSRGSLIFSHGKNKVFPYTRRRAARRSMRPKKNVNIIFEMDRLLSEDQKIVVWASLHEKCSDLQTNLTVQKEFELVADADGVTIEGSTRENVSLTMNQLQNKNDTRLTQTYEIRNAGVTRWTNLLFTFELHRRSYLEYESIKVLTESLETVECEIPSSTNRTTKVQIKYVTCRVGDLRPKSTNLVYLQMRLIHKELESNLDAKQLTYSYKLYLPMQKITRQLSVVTTIWVHDETVPWWLILLAAILGLLTLILLIYALNMMSQSRAAAADADAGDDASVPLKPLKVDDGAKE